MDFNTPRQMELAWPDPEKGPLQLRVWFQAVDGRQAVVGIELWGREPVSAPWPDETLAKLTTPRKISAEDARVTVGNLLDQWIGASLSLALGMAMASDDDGTEECVSEFVEGFRPPLRTRQALDDQFLQMVAGLYELADEAGSRKVAVEIGAELERRGHPASDTTVRSWIRKARKAGYLPPTKSGRATSVWEES
jgi:hypothetical protein